MSAAFAQTYWDVLDRLKSFVKNRPVTASVDMQSYRLCVETALREIIGTRDWKCMRRIWRVILQQTQVAGQVTYTASGGTYPYQVTLTGATWPSWAGTSQLRIGTASIVCQVDTVYSPTVLTLRPPLVPAADVTTASDYSLGMSWYPLPPEFVAAWSPAEKNAWFIGEYIPFEEMMLLTKYRTMTGIVKRWSIGPAPDRYNTMALYVYPWSMATEEEDLVMKFRPRNLCVSGHDPWNYTGTVSVAANDTVVTGVGTAFRSAMEGAIIRFGIDNTNLPTGTNGGNPLVFQQTVASVGSATNLTLTAAAPQAVSACKYVVSDPVDIDAVLYDAFLRNCEKQLSYMCGMKDAREIERVYNVALDRARGQDSPIRQRQVVGEGQRFYTRLRDWKNRPWVGG